ncbi:Hypothetical predicted protein [Mytilus galloprovincialis]|uniref:Uncharacterized protein n=1 Tax=Mytilus galloprovincialis TaxID=29158 RepID=A0A8B6D4E3_MYTGA|nr:Hypothetical predicted protein [Mytilus galloprovincialis]
MAGMLCFRNLQPLFILELICLPYCSILFWQGGAGGGVNSIDGIGGAGGGVNSIVGIGGAGGIGGSSEMKLGGGFVR